MPRTIDGKGFLLGAGVTTQVFGIRIAVDANEGAAGIRRVDQAFAGLGKQAETVNRSASAATDSVMRLGQAAAAAFGGREVLRAADAYNTLNAQLKLATGSLLAGQAAYQSTLDIALKTGQALDEVGNVYRRFAENATALGVSQDQVAASTATVAQAIALSGGSAAGASAALTQFGQALASGTLRGEELNSVLEQAPRLARAIADGMGVQIGQLRSLAAEGRVTSEEILRALENQSARIADEFGALPVTMGRALTNIQTAFTDTVGSLEKGTGAFSALAGGVNLLASNMDALAAAGGVVAAVFAGRMVSGLAAASTAKLAGVAATRALAQAELEEATAAAAAAAQHARLAPLMTGGAVAANGLAAANARLAAAQAGVAAASRGAMVLGALGGPIGLVTTALTVGVTAWSLWGDKATEKTRETARSAVESLDATIAKIEEMNSRLDQVSRKAYTATVAAGESDLKTVRAEIGRLQTELDKLDTAGGRGRYSDQGREMQTALNAQVAREVQLQRDLAEARAGAGQVGTAAINAFVAANAVGADKVRVKQEKLLTEFAQSIANTGGVLDLSNEAHRRAYDALNAGLVEAGKASAERAKVYSAEAVHLDQMADLTKAAAKELAAHAEQEKEYAAAINAALSPLEEQAARLEQEIEFYGMTEAQIQRTIIARLEEARAIAAQNNALPEHLAYLDREIEARKRIASASVQKEVLDGNRDAAKQAASAWERASSDVGRALTDSLFRAFESGQGFGKTFVQSLENTLKSTVLKVAVNYVVDTGGQLLGIAGNAAINALLGTGSSNNGAGTNYLGLANNASTLYSLYNGSYYSAAVGAYNYGSAALGYTYGTNALSQQSLMLAAQDASLGSAGAGTASGGTGASGLGASSVAWIAAIVAGMYLSGDAWQKGIRWENYAAQDNVKYWDAEVGLRALHDEPARMIFGDDFVDSKLYAVLGGGSLSAQIHYAIQSALFGGSWQPSSAQRLTGQITDASGFYGGSVAQDWHKDGGWFKSDKNETRVSPASAELDAAIDQLYGVVRNTYTMLGDVFADPALIAKVKQFTYGVYLPDMSKVIEVLGADLTESMGRYLLPQLSVINRVAGETWLTTFDRVSKEVDAVTGMFGLLGTTIREAFSTTSVDQLFSLSDALVAAMGGLEAMATTSTAYYQRYYSDQERFDAALKQMRESLIDLGVSSIPKTTAEFRALIEAQDLTTAAGQKTYAALMAMSGGFADLADALVAQVVPIEAERLRLAQAVLAENDRLAAQAADLTGNRAAVLAAELAAIDPLNRALYLHVDALTRAQDANERYAASLADLADAGSSIAAFVAGLRMSLLGTASGASLALTRAAYRADLGRAQLGDVAASNAVTGSAQSYLDSARSQSRSRAEYMAIVAMVSGELSALPATQSYAAQQVALLGQLVSGTSDVVAALADLQAALSDAVATGFNRLDVNTNALLTFDELKAGLGGLATDAQIRALIAAADINADGQISKTEALAASTGVVADNTADLSNDASDQINALRQLVGETISNSGRIAELNVTLLNLNASIAQMTADERARATLANKQIELEALYKQQQGMEVAVQAGIDQIWALAKKYGVALNATPGSGWANNATFALKNGLFEASYNEIFGYTNMLAPFKDAFYAGGGAYDQTYGMADDLQAIKAKMDAARQQIVSLGGIPQFARGGLADGWAIVGEQGPELAHFGSPARIYTADQTAAALSGAADGRGLAELIAEVRALRAELAAQRAETQATAMSTGKMARLLDRVMPDGDALAVRAA